MSSPPGVDAPPSSASSEPTPYDRVPYPSKAYAYAHPDRLHVVGRLFGLRPRAPGSARILELGCGEGGHLLPIAAHLPGCEVVGFDLSSAAVAVARRRIAQAGLTNARIEVADISRLPDDIGSFDYIVCHGVYSWVGPEVRRAILQVCRQHLTDQGVAYISYNVYPGWHLHRVARDVMRVHGLRFDDPLEQAQQGMAFIRFLAEQTASSHSAYAAALQQEAGMTTQYSDAYFFHDFLSEHNEPLLLSDFVAQARQAGLQYVGDADLDTMMPNHLPDAVRQMLDRITTDLLDLEQYLDLVRGTSFRRTLLCKPGQSLKRDLGGDDLVGLWVSLCGRPAQDTVDLSTDEPTTFVTFQNVSCNVSDRLGKAALLRLAAIHPASMTFEDLCVAAREWANTEPDPAQEAQVIGGVLIYAYGIGLIDLHPRDRGQVTSTGERPVADAFARLVAAEGDAAAPNRRHEMVPLTRMDRALLPLLDGTRDREAMITGLVQATLEGRITVKVDDVPTEDVEMIREAMGAALQDRIARMCRTSLMVG